MAFSLSAEQEELRSLLAKFLSKEVTSEYLRTRIDKDVENDRELWKKLHELGISAAYSIPPESEGALTFRELYLFAVEAGRVLLPEAFLESVFAGSFSLNHLVAAETLKTLRKGAYVELISAIADGQQRVVLARADDSLHATQRETDVVLEGSARYVPGAAEGNAVLLVGSGGESFLVPMQSQVHVTRLPHIDLTRASYALQFLKAPACPLIGFPHKRFQYLWYVLDAGVLCGIVQRVVEMTCEYVKTREQFGVPVGGFQAVQHQLAEAYLHAEAIRANSAFAAWSADESPAQLPLAALSALRNACAGAPQIIETAIQLHGGIGFTWEHDLHLYLRRARDIQMAHASDISLSASLLECARAQA